MKERHTQTDIERGGRREKAPDVEIHSKGPISLNLLPGRPQNPLRSQTQVTGHLAPFFIKQCRIWVCESLRKDGNVREQMVGKYFEKVLAH